MASRLSGKVSISQHLEFGCIGPGRCEYLTIDYQSIIQFHIFLCFSHSLASEISISSGYIILMKVFTESWLDLTLSDPLRHRGSLQHVAGSP